MTALEQPLKKFVCIVIAMLWLLNLNSQSIYNLVPNYSFEIYQSCTGSYLNNAPPWNSPIVGFGASNYGNSCNPNICWKVPVFDGCHEYQSPRTGNGYAAMYFFNNTPIPNKRNYSAVQLNDTLRSGICYYAEFFVVRYNIANYCVNNVGLIFSDTAIKQQSNGNYIAANPQILNYGNPVIIDSMNWTKVSGIYIAHGGEKYITIGNFKDDSNTDTINTNVPGAYQRGGYFLDDVSVIPIEQDHFHLNANAGPDTTITTGDSVFIGSLLGGTITTTWYNSAGNTIATNVPGLYVSPIQNTFYVLEQNFCTYSSRDTVYVTVTALPVKLLSFAARKQDKNNLLTWRTSTEQNNRGFELQRSTNPANTGTGGKRFSTIAFVPTKAANGTSTTELKYDYVDKKPPAAGSYYRLKQTDFDGKYTFTNVVFIKGEPETELVLASLYPNPTYQLLNVILQSPKAQTIRLIISDAAGKVVLQHNLQLQKGENNKTINVLALAKGAYIVKVITDGGETVVSKFVKE